MRTRDPFPKQGRIRGEYAAPIELIDPLEAEIIRIEAQRQAAIAAVAEGKHVDADPQDLRGIPCIARGVGGTSPGTDPARVVGGNTTWLAGTTYKQQDEDLEESRWNGLDTSDTDR